VINRQASLCDVGSELYGIEHRLRIASLAGCQTQPGPSVRDAGQHLVRSDSDRRGSVGLDRSSLVVIPQSETRTKIKSSLPRLPRTRSTAQKEGRTAATVAERVPRLRGARVGVDEEAAARDVAAGERLGGLGLSGVRG